MRHGQEHFAEVFRLRHAGTLKFDFVQLGHAINQFGHLLAKLFFDVVGADVGVFHHIVQQGCHDGGQIHVHIGQNAGHRNRVADVRLAGFTHHALMGLVGIAVCLPNLGDVFGFKVVF